MISDNFTVLIADDNPNNLFTLETLIHAHMPARILRAEHGEEVLAILLKEKVDLIILDVHMPRMDGFECAKLIRMRPSDRDIPILFLTASMRSDEARDQGLDLGAVDYLRKPIDDRILINKLKGFRQLVTRERVEQEVLHQRVQKTSEELADAQELTTEVVGSMVRGLLVVRGDQVLLRNPAFDQLVAQVPMATLDGQSRALLSHLECSDLEIDDALNGRGFAARERPWSPTRIGELASWLRLSATALDDGRVMVVVEDITERKIFEQTLRDALSQAESASRAKTEFLGNMSHEVRTPLNGILGIAQLLRRGEVLPSQERYFRLLEESSHRLLRIVNDVLDFAQVEEGQVRLVHQSFDLWQLVDDLVALHQPAAAQKGLELSLYRDPAPNPLVFGDEQRLSQVLVNLINNSMKFTEVGRVQVDLRVIETSEQSMQVRLTVSDTGIGIPEQQLETLFERFAQGDASRTKRFAGTGLGLAICKALVDAMGGRLEATSQLDKGTSFTLHLSLDFAESTAPDHDLKNDAADHWSGARVLVAEDDPVNQLVVQAMLENLGIYVEIAGHGAEAVRVSEAGGFDLILMDLHMPHLDGLQASAAIRARGDQTPIIALTANILPDTPEECQEAGMDGFLSKPMTLEDLEHRLRITLGRAPAKIAPDSSKRSDQAAYHQRTKTRPIDAVDTRLDQSFIDQQRDLLGPAFGAMITAYIEGMQKGVLAMRAALASGEVHELRGHAHKAKSSSLQMGAEGMVERCKELEMACLDETPIASLGAQIDQIAKAFELLRPLIEAQRP